MRDCRRAPALSVQSLLTGRVNTDSPPFQSSYGHRPERGGGGHSQPKAVCRFAQPFP